VSTVDNKQLAVLMIIPFGLLLLYLIDRNEEPTATTGKEQYYLTFNKDEIFKNLIATEEHFRNIDEQTDVLGKEGFLNCAVKHLASAEGHADEAISHSLIVENKEKSKKFEALRDEIRNLRHDLQQNSVTVSEGIERTRRIRHTFETLNPEYDVSKCASCKIIVEVKP